MCKIAITGGIGSGKSYVCHLLEKRGIRVYDCDRAAKRLMREDADLQSALCRLVGEEVYRDGVLQKAVLAKFLLSSKTHQEAVNDIVHPAVARDFEQSGLQWLESAILFDSGFIHRTRFDYVVAVVAPEPVRVARVMARDHIPADKAQAWIHAQWPQDRVAAQSHFTVVNDGVQDLERQIDQILEKIKQKK